MRGIEFGTMQTLRCLARHVGNTVKNGFTVLACVVRRCACLFVFSIVLVSEA